MKKFKVIKEHPVLEFFQNLSLPQEQQPEKQQ